VKGRKGGRRFMRIGFHVKGERAKKKAEKRLGNKEKGPDRLFSTGKKKGKEKGREGQKERPLQGSSRAPEKRRRSDTTWGGKEEGRIKRLKLVPSGREPSPLNRKGKRERKEVLRKGRKELAVNPNSG